MGTDNSSKRYGDEQILSTDEPYLQINNYNIWEVAAAQLTPAERALINFSCPDTLKLLSELHAFAVATKEQCVQKR